jgi:transmembrane protein 216
MALFNAVPAAHPVAPRFLLRIRISLQPFLQPHHQLQSLSAMRRDEVSGGQGGGSWSQSSLQSTLPLQVLLYFHPYYWLLFYITAVVLLIYKAVVWPYPKDILAAEAVALSFLAVIDAGRLAVGHKGNLTQTRLPLLLFLLLSIPVIIGHVFFVSYQTYVMRLDQIINVIALVRVQEGRDVVAHEASSHADVCFLSAYLRSLSAVRCCSHSSSSSQSCRSECCSCSSSDARLLENYFFKFPRPRAARSRAIAGA